MKSQNFSRKNPTGNSALTSTKGGWAILIETTQNRALGLDFLEGHSIDAHLNHFIFWVVTKSQSCWIGGKELVTDSYLNVCPGQFVK